MKLPKIVYGYELEYFQDQDPEDLAEECLEINGGSYVEIYQGTPYTPELQDEVEFMEGEGFRYLVKDVKVFGIYKDGCFK